MGEAGVVEAAAVRAGVAGPPALPGVYAFRDAAGGLLYVGTSRSLARRVASYFAPHHPPGGKTGRIARLAVRVGWRTTPSVLEALVLEARTIRRERPHFNRRLKQTGRHVWVRFDPRDPFPRLEESRTLEPGPWRHLGPLPGGRATRVALERLSDVLGLRTCTGRLAPDPHARACLRLDLGQCAAPCLGHVRPGAYGRQLTRALTALGGGDAGDAARAGGRAGAPVAPLPAPVTSAIAALMRSRRAVRVIACVPAAGEPGHRLVAVAGGRVRQATTLRDPAALPAAVARLAAALAPMPPLVVPREDLDEVRIVTAWLAGPEGRRASVDLDRLGRAGVEAWVASRLAPGPLFSSAGR